MITTEKIEFMLSHKDKQFEYRWSGNNPKFSWVKTTYDELILKVLFYDLKIDGCDFREVERK